MTQILQLPRTGDLVRIRRRRWRIVDVRAYDGCHVIALAGTGERHIGSVRSVIAPFETIEPLERPARLRVVTPRRWRRACRALLADTSPPGALRAGRRARIDLLPHQLEPALAVVRGFGSRLLLADDVGLGKTIQAALVLSELRERGLVDRALILTPASLRDQWAKELADRFQIEAAVFDAHEVRRRLAELPLGVNPWSTAPVAIASFEYVKRPETLTAISACRWDALIVDEAHVSAGDSERHGAVAALAGRSPYVLLLTATPHNGDNRAFLSLCATGAHDDPLLVFRRTRHDVCLGPGRRIHRLLVRPNEAERRMHAMVVAFGRAGYDSSSPAWLALAVLNKRALSSARSLLHTIERRLATLDSRGTSDQYQIGLPLWDPDGETDDQDRPPDLVGLAFGDPERERALLRELATAARAAALGATSETKIKALVRLLRRVAEPAIVFTEYRDTLLHLQRVIDRPAAILHGGLTRRERLTALEDFVEGRRSILLATDAAGEGLNLQYGCRIVINFELPWNPMRLEQRIGRVDRIGQRRTVHAFHLIARETAEARILDRLRARIARAQAAIGAPDPLGVDDERTIARWIVSDAKNGAGREDEPSTDQEAIDTSSQVSQDLPPTLKLEAIAEASRLTELRRFTAARDDDVLARLDVDGAWLTFARCRATRKQLGARILFIFNAALENTAGRQVESTLVPVVVEWSRVGPDRLNRHLIEAVRRAISSDVLDRADIALAAWHSQAVSLSHAVIEARLVRERALARLVERSVSTIQPGLFDRRAERLDFITRLSAADAAAEAARRIAGLDQALNLSARPFQLLLVLAP